MCLNRTLICSLDIKIVLTGKLDIESGAIVDILLVFNFKLQPYTKVVCIKCHLHNHLSAFHVFGRKVSYFEISVCKKIM